MLKVNKQRVANKLVALLLKHGLQVGAVKVESNLWRWVHQEPMFETEWRVYTASANDQPAFSATRRTVDEALEAIEAEMKKWVEGH